MTVADHHPPGGSQGAPSARTPAVEPGDGVDEVLVTHEHPDHLDIAKLVAASQRNSAFRVYLPPAAIESVPELGGTAVAVEAGQRFTAAGFAVDVVGGAHAEIYDGLPGCANVGFVVDGTVYHRGDSLFVPPSPVETLFVPAAAPWLKLSEALDFVRAVPPEARVPDPRRRAQRDRPGVLRRLVGPQGRHRVRAHPGRGVRGNPLSGFHMPDGADQAALAVSYVSGTASKRPATVGGLFSRTAPPCA
ncbi:MULTISPECIES: MBL fold metallo-hydrolase [unclassified Streptomyces]|uniref:MBL fold metallo-hydrolase n=1 Tax=unclassified Streptomyces TaxID=2593676 RepID=UPI001319CCF1|nr:MULTISPECIES: MBL fold metallo-hydrolase [unclassified Streptomyces]MYX38090.1 MBL fold metallo-hydrolase [Streptomyces sp. SID8377]